jgi:hypothetical protein
MLLDSDGVMELVPADNVIDTTKRPDLFPRVNISMGQTVFERFFCTCHVDLHLWVREEGAVIAMRLTDSVIEAISIDAQIDGVLRLESFVCHDLSVEQARYVPDPDGSISHAVVSATAIVKAI